MHLAAASGEGDAVQGEAAALVGEPAAVRVGQVVVDNLGLSCWFDSVAAVVTLTSGTCLE